MITGSLTSQLLYLREIVRTVLCGVPSVVVSGFYCRRVGYGILVVGGVFWGLWRVLCHALSVRKSVCVKLPYRTGMTENPAQSARQTTNN